MARKPRFIYRFLHPRNLYIPVHHTTGVSQHIIQRGNNREPSFFREYCALILFVGNVTNLYLNNEK